eukprot:m51a1_g2648 hypothetical protein (826) ;mRNA; r:615952-620352
MEALETAVAELERINDLDASGTGPQRSAARAALSSLVAASSAQMAAGIEADDAAWWYLRGRLLVAWSNAYTSEAETCLTRACKKAPGMARAWNAMAELLWRKNDLCNAKHCYLEALSRNRNNKETLRGYSMVLRQLAQAEGVQAQERGAMHDESLRCAKDAVSADPSDGYSWYVLGNAHVAHALAFGESDQELRTSLKAYDKSAQLGYSSPDLHFNRAAALRYCADFEASACEYARAGKLDPQWPAPPEEARKISQLVDRLCALISRPGAPARGVSQTLPPPGVADSVEGFAIMHAAVVGVCTAPGETPVCAVLELAGRRRVVAALYGVASSVVHAGDVVSVFSPKVETQTFAAGRKAPATFECVRVRHEHLGVNGKPVEKSALASGTVTIKTSTPKTEAHLWSAWLLRVHVLPVLHGADDLMALALAFPSALGSQALSRVPVQATTTADLRCPDVVALSRRPFRLVASLASVPLDDAPVRLPAALHWVCSRLCEAFGHTDCARAMERCYDTGCVAVSARDALWVACLCGLPEMVDVLGRAPFSLGQADARAGSSRALWSACSGGHVHIVRALARDPYRLGAEDARAQDCYALVTACSNGHAKVVEELAREPYCLSQADARLADSIALRSACSFGHPGILAALAGAPWFLDGTDARKRNNEALAEACRNGHAEVVRMLGKEPYRLGQAEARMNNSVALLAACSNGHASVVNALGSVPYSLGQEDARNNNSCVFRWACRSGSPQVVRALAEPPFSLGKEDAIANGSDALRGAAAAGHAEVVTELARAPFSLGREDAVGLDFIHPKVVSVLQDAPYCLSSEEIRARS